MLPEIKIVNFRKYSFLTALICLFVYELAMLALSLTGVSFLKLALTGLVWVSFFIALYEYVNFHHYFKKSIPPLAYVNLTLLLIWNVFNVVRSIVNRDGALTTMLGNVSASLAILVPFTIIFSMYLINLKVIHQYYFQVLKIGVLVFLAFLLFKGRNLSDPQMVSVILLFSPIPFLITSVPLQSNKNKLFVLVGILGLLGTGYLYSGRTAMIRVILLTMCLVGLFFMYRFKQKWLLPLSCLVLFLPFVLLKQSYETGESALEKYLGNTSDDEYSVDTRTFLYKELYLDLVKNNKLIIGKGANGSYFSEYFYSIDLGETHNRNNIEVGILGILLKGGLIAVVLNLTLLFLAIYYCFFKSNNLYTIGIGYILMVHVILLFIENFTIYSSYNVFLWFFIGVGISKKFRDLSNEQVRKLIRV